MADGVQPVEWTSVDELGAPSAVRVLGYSTGTRRVVGEPSAARGRSLGPVPVRTWEGVSPVPAQMREG